MADENNSGKENQPEKRKKTLRPTSVASSVLSSDVFDANCSIVNQAQQNKQHKLKQRFTVLKKLGKGTYGKVQLAINKETGQEVAIKTIKKTKIENEQDLQRVRREIQIMSSIEHPHIVHIYEVFENKDKIVLVMQYAPGGELYEYVSQCKVLDDSEARRLFRQIATAIFYCHQNKICHRDLKLENILLDEKNNAKLADFGLSNVFDKSRVLKTFCGSPLYASPEIVQGSPYEGPEVDCWSLGVLLYTLVYGAMPFDGSNFKRLVKQISEASYYEPKQKSQASPLIGRLLCADPQKRATIVDICSDPWINGSLIAASPRVSPTVGHRQLQPVGGHTCLLKVAQDMANLTPVRLDILLALAPAAVQAPAGIKTVADLADGQQRQRHKVPTGDEQHQQQPKRRPTLSPTTFDREAAASLMEVDNEQQRTSSPVASYVVRDCTMARDKSPVQAPMRPFEQDQETKMVVEDMSALEVWEGAQQLAPPCQEADAEATQGQENEKTLMEQTERQSDGAQLMEICTDVALVPVEVKILAQTERQASVQVIPIKVDESFANVIEVEQVVPESCTPPLTEPQADKTQSQVQALDLSLNPDSGNSCVPESRLESVEADKEKVSLNEATTPVQTEPKPDQPSAETPDEADKPMKKKKKIVVVKKKKKACKKDEEELSGLTATRQTGNEQSNKKEEAEEVDNGKHEHDNRQVPAAKAAEQEKAKQQQDLPGKVKIPDTFIKPDAQQQLEQITKPKTMKLLGRRQSTLIADVSQKLMQQHQQSLSSAATHLTAIDTDQPQLASVRVSDKKNEFERRASLAAVYNTSTPPTNTSPKGSQALNSRVETLTDLEAHKQAAAEQQQQQQRAIELRRELVSVDTEKPLLQTSIVEPVMKANQQEAAPLLKQLDLSEPITPTSYTSDASTLLPLDTRRLRERVEQLEDTRDERSDSVETIKAEQQATIKHGESIRTSAELKLSSGEDTRKRATTSSLDSVSEATYGQGSRIGPAPITRSYKKVTFTPDGTCITETGKIYSTQGDDGRLRRIERKSKVTHYAGDGDAAHRDSQALEEEIVVEGGDQEETCALADHWKRDSFQSAFSRVNDFGHQRVLSRPFERLIMPSTSFFGDPTDPDVEQSTFSSSKRSSSRQPNEEETISRADSVSSCSSGSTDIFDDIFDTWTGAISMFNKPTRRLSELHRALIKRTPLGGDGGQPNFLFGAHRRSGSSSSTSGRPQPHRPQSTAGGHFNSKNQSERAQRCGSVEPSSAHWRPYSATSRRGRNKQHPRDPTWTPSGYDSDAQMDPFTGWRDRPNSAKLSNARGRTFGSSNLFVRRSDANDFVESSDTFGFEPASLAPFSSDASTLMQEIELEHERLRQKLANCHPKFWKGSTPSLANAGLSNDKAMFAEEPRHVEQQQHQQQQRHMQPMHRSGSSSSHQRPPIGPRASNPQQTSHSSSGLQGTIRPSKPLDAAPTRRNTANLADHMAHVQAQRQEQTQSVVRSVSRTSITNLLNSLRLSDRVQDNRMEQLRQQQQQQTFIRPNVSSNSSSAFWGSERFTAPSESASFSMQNSPVSANNNNELPEHPDARIQNWLLDQSATGGNISSISSGSKSSASDPNQPTSEIRGQLMQQQQHLHHQLQRAESQATTMTSASMRSKHLPPLGPFNTSSAAIRQSAAAASGQQQEQRTSMVSLNTSSSRQSISSQQRVEMRDACFVGQSNEQAAINSNSAQISTAKHQVTKSVFSFASSSSSHCQIVTAPLGDESKQQQKTINLSRSSSTQRQQTLAPLCGEPTLMMNPDDELDSVLDQESRSSSSLLDQLRSRGYRSMINQRLVNSSSASTSSSSQQALVQSQTTAQSTIVTQLAADATGESQDKQQTIRMSLVMESKGGSKSPRDWPDLSQNPVNSRGISETGPTHDFALAKAGEPEKTALESSHDGAEQHNLDHSNKVELASPGNNDTSEKVHEPEPAGKKEEVEEMDEDEDDDVKEAKANIKGFLDRARETEEFIKSVQKQEESQERQRQQQLFLFKNLLLSTRLNGLPHLNSTATEATTTCGSAFNFLTPTPNSAPVQTISNGSQGQPQQLENSVFNSDLFRPQSNNYSAPISYAQRPTCDPLEPVPPICSNLISSAKYSSSWRQSRSHLADQFWMPATNSSLHSSDRTFTTSSRSCRPVSAAIYSDHKSSPFFRSSSPSGGTSSSLAAVHGGRSLSQVRHHYEPGSAFVSLPNDNKSDNFTSEYKSSFGPNLRGNSVSSKSPLRRATSALCKSGAALQVLDDGDSDDDDIILSSHQARSYVPRSRLDSAVIAKRSSFLGARDSSPLSSLRRTSVATKSHYSHYQPSYQTAKEPYVPSSSVERRRRMSMVNSSCASTRNLSDDDNNDDSGRSPQRRRCSERALSSGRLPASQMENSRLIELEQRIQANKKRREQLLAGVPTESPPPSAAAKIRPTKPDAIDNSELDDEDDDFGFERPIAKPQLGRASEGQVEEHDLEQSNGSQQVALLTPARKMRSSRLESMEARIKRRSYCVRVSSPDHNKQPAGKQITARL